MRRLKSFAASFYAAGRGIVNAVCEERNLRFHLVAMAAVLCLKRYYSFTDTQNVLLYLTIGMVIAAELVNTAVERVVDLCCPKPHPLAAKAKDAAAGAVLAAAIMAVAIGVKLFWKPDILQAFFAEIFGSPLHIVLLLAAAIIGVWFIFFFEDDNSKK